jgi:hypothetical protein
LSSPVAALSATDACVVSWADADGAQSQASLFSVPGLDAHPNRRYAHVTRHSWIPWPDETAVELQLSDELSVNDPHKLQVRFDLRRQGPALQYALDHGCLALRSTLPRPGAPADLSDSLFVRVSNLPGAFPSPLRTAMHMVTAPIARRRMDAVLLGVSPADACLMGLVDPEEWLRYGDRLWPWSLKRERRRVRDSSRG